MAYYVGDYLGHFEDLRSLGGAGFDPLDPLAEFDPGATMLGVSQLARETNYWGSPLGLSGRHPLEPIGGYMTYSHAPDAVKRVRMGRKISKYIERTAYRAAKSTIKTGAKFGARTAIKWAGVASRNPMKFMVGAMAVGAAAGAAASSYRSLSRGVYYPSRRQTRIKGGMGFNHLNTQGLSLALHYGR